MIQTPSRFRFVFRIPGFLEWLATRARLDVDVILELDGLELSSKARIVRESASVAEGQTGRLALAKLLNGQSAGPRPGDFVCVSIAEPELPNVAVLPSAALDFNSGVLVAEDGGRLSEAAVRLLRKQGNEVIVEGRALEGRMIVADRSPLLGAGIRVRPIQPPPGGANLAQQFDETETAALSDEERSNIVALAEANQRIPDRVKQRIRHRLNQGSVPREMVDRPGSQAGS